MILPKESATFLSCRFNFFKGVSYPELAYIGKTTLQSLRNSGKIGYIRIDDGSVRYPVTEIIRYMESNGIHSNSLAYGE